MAASHRELDSFLQKYKYLCSAGFKATVSFASENCCTHVTLEVDLPFLSPPRNSPPPYTLSPQSPRNRSPSYFRRLKRRRDARECSKVESSEENKVHVVDEADMPQGVNNKNLCMASPYAEEKSEAIALSEGLNVATKEVHNDEAEGDTIAVDEVLSIADEKRTNDDGASLTTEQVDVTGGAPVTLPYPVFRHATASYPVFGQATTYPLFGERRNDGCINRFDAEDRLEQKQDSLSQLRSLTNRLNTLAEPTLGSVRK